MDELRQAILKTIQKFDGQYGWYQIDRAISTSGIVISDNLLSVLRDLEAQGLISSMSDGKSKDPKYLLTSLGQSKIQPGRTG